MIIQCIFMYYSIFNILLNQFKDLGTWKEFSLSIAIARAQYQPYEIMDLGQKKKIMHSGKTQSWHLGIQEEFVPHTGAIRVGSFFFFSVF